MLALDKPHRKSTVMSHGRDSQLHIQHKDSLWERTSQQGKRRKALRQNHHHRFDLTCTPCIPCFEKPSIARLRSFRRKQSPMPLPLGTDLQELERWEREPQLESQRGMQNTTARYRGSISQQYKICMG